MQLLRGKLLVAFFFLLISLGQAYPYAMAYNHGTRQECTCSLKQRSCQHGCDLGKAKKSRRGIHHVSKSPSGGETKPLWVNPNCSKQKHQKILSFTSDPFLPVKFVSFPGRVFKEDCFSRTPHPKGILLACESPPPKENTPSQEDLH